MSLDEYRQKRNFSRTPEPEGQQQAPPEGALRFVVQKHQASHLHYDFRLEVDGVLKSWALPKGPTLNPDEKKLAMMTEDHPWEYRNFEGVIAEGNYGAGTVMIWDEGDYSVPGAHSRAESEEKMRHGLDRGRIEFTLEGKKLKGSFYLVQMKNDGRAGSWLLIKRHDEFAGQGDVLLQDHSARSGQTMEEIRAQGNVYHSQEKAAPQIDLSRFDLHGAKHAPMPAGLEPMLATLAEAPFDREGWIYELKWDGFRAIAEVRRDEADLCSRHNKSYVDEFAPVVADLKRLGIEALIDGEVVVVDEKGRADFKLLQNYRKTGKGLLVFYVFDLLYLEGYDLRTLPLWQRKEILRQLLPALPRIKYSDHVEDEGVALYKLAVQNDLEGIIAKDRYSQYRSGVRSQDWLKFKIHLRQEAVICGWTEPRGSRTDLGALLLGVYQSKELVYVGHTGGGFTQPELAEIKKKLQPLVRPNPPFKRIPKTNAPATWVEPSLICEVKFSEWTEEGYMRQPIFLGLREDKDPYQVRREKPIPASQALERKKFIPHESGKKETFDIGGRQVTVTNPHKVFWPEEGLTKEDYIAYYRALAPILLPYLRDRPLSLHRFPNGIEGKSFFQKDVDDAPDWVQRVKIESSSSKEGHIDFVLCQDEASLVWVANGGSIELNPWNSRVGHLDNPDYLVVDLDPLERTFNDVIRVAQVIHAIFEEIEADHYLKTSGATGLHVYMPLGAQYSYEQVRQFALLVNRLAHDILPEITSLERMPSQRRGKVYLDYLQNRSGQTMAAVYSLRPRPRAPVSTPLKWEELQSNLDPTVFNIKNTLDRLDRVGDLWKGVLGPGIDMAGCLDRLGKRWNKILEKMKG